MFVKMLHLPQKKAAPTDAGQLSRKCYLEA
jgi:hypothetical protein